MKKFLGLASIAVLICSVASAQNRFGTGSSHGVVNYRGADPAPPGTYSAIARDNKISVSAFGNTRELDELLRPSVSDSSKTHGQVMLETYERGRAAALSAGRAVPLAHANSHAEAIAKYERALNFKTYVETELAKIEAAKTATLKGAAAAAAKGAGRKQKGGAAVGALGGAGTAAGLYLMHSKNNQNNPHESGFQNAEGGEGEPLAPAPPSAAPTAPGKR